MVIGSGAQRKYTQQLRSQSELVGGSGEWRYILNSGDISIQEVVPVSNCDIISADLGPDQFNACPD